MSLEGAIAAHRFGLGARPGEIARASANPKAWLMDQLNGSPDQPKSPGGQPFHNAGQLVMETDDYDVQKFLTKGERKKEKALKKNPATQNSAAVKMALKNARSGGRLARRTQYMEEMGARFAHGFTTDKPFAERIVRFWSNHFTISVQHRRVLMFAGDFEREAIRPHINGSFEDMLFAVCMHPAMQLYLDNWHSIGPDSPAGAGGKEKKKRGPRGDGTLHARRGWRLFTG
jgi:uncharacterized protein (DUF1800 family)